MDVVYAKYSGQVTLPDGGRAAVQGGSHWPASDPVVAANPAMFTPDPRYGLQWYGDPPPEMSEPPVEQASAAPGEKRPVGRPRGSRNG
jgi:hypothetical protein